MKHFNDYYRIHNSQYDESLYQIAEKYQSDVLSIITANPQLNPFLLDQGTPLVIPTKKPIVDITKPYDYEQLTDDVMLLKTRYPFLEVETIGFSVEDREIYGITFGEGENLIIYNGAHHGNEWITSLLLMKWLEDICYGYSINASVKGFELKVLYNHSKVMIVPMVNPDGVELVINGFNNIQTNQNKLLKMNGYNSDFSQWKANIRGVDLNRNYPASWKTYKKIEQQDLGITGPNPSKFAGIQPLSEPESKCMYLLTMRSNTRLTLSFHSQGEVIYWQYLGKGAPESFDIANALSEISGYKLEDEAFDEAYAGYKDWYIEQFSKPGFTIEVGLGTNPLEIEQFNQIYEKNEALMLLAAMI